MNPETNRFEQLSKSELSDTQRRQLDDLEKQFNSSLLRPDGSPVPKHWTVLTVGEKVEIKGYTFEVKYIGETSILFEPVGLVIDNKGEK